jgi:hypothetical protein
MVATYPWINFHKSSSDDIIKYMPPDTNLIVSQSALEHFENDLLFFRQIRDFVDSKRSPLLQIHLSTTPACLELYGLHGVREYTPRSTSMIAKLFDKTSYSLMFQLGGDACNRVHMDYIMNPLSTQGIDLRNTKTIEYDRRVKSAIIQDMANYPRNPSFFALVIHSLYHRPIWD